MSDEQANGETRAERIKRKWDEGEPERAARRAQRKAAPRAERGAVGLIRRTGHRLADLGWHLLVTLMVLAVVVALPAVVVGVFINPDAGAMVGGAMIGILLCACVVMMSAGTDYSGDW